MPPSQLILQMFVLKSIHTKMLIWQSKNIKPENTFNICHQMPTCLNFVLYVDMSRVHSSVFIRCQNVSFFKTCTLVLQVSQELKLASLLKVNNCILNTACVSFFFFLFNLTYSCGLCRPKPASQITNINNTIVDF